MDDGSIDVKRAAREAAYSMPLDQDQSRSDPEIFRTGHLGALARASAGRGSGALGGSSVPD